MDSWSGNRKGKQSSSALARASQILLEPTWSVMEPAPSPNNGPSHGGLWKASHMGKSQAREKEETE